MRKYSKLIVLLLIILTFLSGCRKTPLSDKSIDEKVVMCLEDTYPEHQFYVVHSYDLSKDEGTYKDEDGVEFNVHNILRNTNYHFGCTDEYFSTLLSRQNYMQILEDIDSRYDAKIICIEEDVSIEVDLYEEVNLQNVAEMIFEILNSVEIPKMIFPEKTSFSTGELNYYTYPNGDVIACDFVDEERVIRGYVLFQFSERETSVEDIISALSIKYQELLEGLDTELKENNDTEYEEIKIFETDYSQYTLLDGWGQTPLCNTGS